MTKKTILIHIVVFSGRITTKPQTLEFPHKSTKPSKGGELKRVNKSITSLGFDLTKDLVLKIIFTLSYWTILKN